MGLFVGWASGHRENESDLGPLPLRWGVSTLTMPSRAPRNIHFDSVTVSPAGWPEEGCAYLFSSYAHRGLYPPCGI